MLAQFFPSVTRTARMQIAVIVALSTLTATSGWAQISAERIRPIYSAEELQAITPKSPNPYVAFLPEGVEPDWEYWNSWLRVERQKRIAERGVRAGTPVSESEPNDTTLAPNLLPNFGSGGGQIKSVTISGTAGFPPGLDNFEPIEDNGNIVVAASTTLSTQNRFYSVSGHIGNGLYGSSGFGTGDFDFYRLDDVPAGRILEVQVDARLAGSNLNPALVVYNSSGTVLASASNDATVLFGQEEVIVNHDASLRLTIPAFGDYYVAVFGEPENAPGTLMANPFNSASGFGAATQGFYTLYLRLFDPVFSRPENDGSLNLATVVPSHGGVYSSQLGNGPFGDNSGDFDFYAMPNLQRGDLLIADIDATGSGSELNSFLAIWNSAGKLVAWNDDDPFASLIFSFDNTLFQLVEFDSFIAFEIPADGTYYVSVGSWFSPYPTDPFDASSGLGVATTGPYQLSLRVQPLNPDVFAMDLKTGDIIGADLTLFHGNLELLDPSGKLIVDSHVNAGGVYPDTSPLPIEGDSALGYVVPEDGRYFIRYSTFGRGDYTANLTVNRPVLEAPDNPEPRQRLFIDFDGVSDFDNSVFPGVEEPKIAEISGLEAALSGWGLDISDRDTVIDAILSNVRESLRTDLLYPRGLNPLYDVEILNSRDHADPWGNPDVSRVIVGGTIAQLDIPTIGIAESIDIGNFNTTETAIVLLDLLSSPASNPNSLNGIQRDISVGIIDLIGVAVGNIVAHEAGHFFGDFHTENQITEPNIMDQGGNLANTIGLGPDNTLGTADDIDVDFGVDKYAFLEGFTGHEDTLNLIALSLSAPPRKVLYVNFNRAENGIGTFALPFNTMKSGLNNVPHDGTLRIFPGASNETFRGATAINQRVTVDHSGTGAKAVLGKP